MNIQQACDYLQAMATISKIQKDQTPFADCVDYLVDYEKQNERKKNKEIISYEKIRKISNATNKK